MKKTVLLLAAGVAASGAFATGTLRSGGSFLEGAWRAGDSYITNHSEVAYRPVTLKASPDPGYGVAGWYYRTTFNLSANENLENWTALPDGNATSCTISASAPFTSDTHYIALNLRYVKYSLSLNYNGGGGPSSSMTGLCVTNTVTLPVPDSRDGYDFVNWTGANGSVFPAGEPLEQAVALGIANADTNFTLTAQWMPHTMSISYVLDGGDFGIEHPDEATNGVAFKVSAPTRTGYSFQGWLVTGYDQYTAKWGTSAPPSNYFAAGSACPPGGGDVWFLNLTPQQDGVVTLTAKWEAKKYNVTLVVSGANNNPTTSLTATYGQTTPSVTTTPRYDNADFMGFYTQPNGQGEKYWNSDGTPYVATWTNDVDMTFYEYKGNIRRLLTFHGNGGVPSQTVTNAVVGATYGSVMPIVSWSGGRYVFAGWFTTAAGGDEVSAEALVAEGSGDIDLYAHWEVAKYCVRFDGNGATNETAMAVQEIPFDAATPLIANEYGKPGYGFAGWTTNGTVATSVDFADCAAVSNLADTAGTTTAVYAVWSPNTYYVSFNPNGGKGSMPVMTNLYGEASVFPENDFTRSGFWSFSCWSNTLSGAMSLPGTTFSNLTTEAGATVRIDAAWSNTLSRLSQAMHCDNLDWINCDFGKSGSTYLPWIVEEDPGLGYESSGSQVSQPKSYASLQAKVETNGVLTFRCRMSSGAAGTMRIWIAPTNTCEFNAGEVLWKDEVPIPAGEGWTNAEIQVTQVGVIENPPLYVNISNWTSGDSLCIDMMKWVPDGGDEPIEPGDEDVPFPAGSVTVSGYAGKYDGAEHGISVQSGVAGFTARYCDEQYGDFTADAPTLTDVGSLTVWCEISAPGYITETNSATVAISRREVSLTSGSDSKAYDGSPLQCADIHVGGDGFATGEGAGFNVTGSQTDVGESENAFTYMLNEGTKADNYAIATSNGTLTVTKASVGPGGGEEPGGGAVPTGGESKFDKACDYDGEGHTIDTNALVAAFGAAMVGGATVEYAVDDGSGASGGVGHAALPWVNEPSVYTNAGEYIVWYRVTNPNYEDFEHAAKVTVKTAENTWISEPSIAGWTSGQAASEPDMGVAKFGVASVTYGETGTTPPVDAGDYTAVFTVPATENYTGLAKSVPFTVAPEPPVIHIPGEGKVVVPKTWKTGQKVTWKATAAKGSVFAHWEGPFVDKLELSRNELRNPSLQFSMPAEFNTNWISAVFIAVDDDRLGNLTLSQPGPFAPNEDVDGLRVVDDSESYVTASVSGLPAGLKFNAKTLAITGKPTKSGVYWAQIKAKNASGYQWAENVKMTVSGEGPEANEPKLTRTAYYPLTVICATEGGTVVGTGVYADGKKVSVTAKPARGWAFAGWYLDAGLAEPAAFATGDMRSTSQSVMVPEVRYLFARFVVESDDVDSLKIAVGDAQTDPDGTFSLDLGACVESLSLPKLAVTGLPAGLKYDAKTLRISGKATKPGVYTVKVAATNASVKKATDAPSTSFKITVPNFECDAMPNLESATDAYGIVFAGVVFSPGRIDCTPENGWSVRVAGLPTGLKYDAKTGKISGVPTAKAGSYTVTFTASKKGEANQVATITLNVESLPAWAVGTFDGAIEDGASDDELGTALLAVAANGKISGKILEGGRTWTLSAASFDSVDDPKSETESQVFIATVIGKIGKEIVSNDVELAAASVDGVDVGVASGSAERRDGAAVALYRWATCQNLWKRVDTKADMPVFKANIVKTVELAEPGDTDNALKLTFKANGVVAFSGKVGGVNASGSSQLVPVLPDEGVAAPYQVTLYAPPKGASAGLHETYFVELELEGAIVKDVIFK